ncbi:MAG: sulfite exporter TauE/SafE family protein [Bilophila wadsworthia]
MVPCARHLKKMLGIIAGTRRALLAPHLPGLFLRGFFAFFVMLVGVHLLFNSTPAPDRAARTGHASGQHLIGLISSLAGIAGTMLCVIFLVWAAIDWADAVGTSAALSLPISLTGTLGYAIAGWNFPELPPYSVGFVYLPGMFCLLVSSMSMAVVGARLAHSPRLPMQALRRCFAVGNILLGLSILRSVLFR